MAIHASSYLFFPKSGVNQQFDQWLSLKGGRWHIIPQLAVYTTYILPSRGLYASYHLLREPEATIDLKCELYTPDNDHMTGWCLSPCEDIMG